ncbi:MAG: glycosyltransferase family 9 protein [Candidatus Cloacimonetes bacterium]|nr:glycosyltransferase family 9 protein [Candidatus Cloacimonadota bacterium]
MYRILVVNLTRMGDLIQTIPLINSLKIKYQEAQIDLLVMSSFASIVSQIDNVDRVISLSDESLVTKINEDIWSAYLELKNKIELINNGDYRYDLLVNVVASVQAAFLGYLINADKKLGIFINSNREQTITAQWSAYHLANEHNLGDHSFNLIDIFANIGNTHAEENFFYLRKDFEAEKKADSFWQKIAASGKKSIGFHIGASRSNKVWEVEKFREVIELILEQTNHKVFLFGGYSEITLNSYFSNLQSEKFVNLIGKSKLADLSSLISRVDLFITNDTGPMHIAAALKKKIINLSLGPVSMWETSPYVKGAVIIQADISCHPCKFSHVCHHQDCHKLITTEALYETIRYVLGEGPSFDPDVFPGMNFWQTTFDISGFQYVIPLKKRRINRNELLFEIKRLAWTIVLSSHFRDSQERDLHHYIEKVTEDYFKMLNKNYYIVKFDYQNEIDALHEMGQLCKTLASFYFDMKSYSSENKKSIDKISDLYKESNQIKKELFRKAEFWDVFYDFFLFAQFSESSLENTEIGVLLIETEKIYSKLYLQLYTLEKNLNSYNLIRR